MWYFLIIFAFLFYCTPVGRTSDSMTVPAYGLTYTLSKISNWSLYIFQRQLSIIDFTLNYPPIRNNLTSASLLSLLIETDYLNYPPIKNNLTSASLLSMLIETDYNFKKITAVFFRSCLKEFHSVWSCLFI